METIVTQIIPNEVSAKLYQNSMYAILEIGNRQYRVAQNDEILIEKVDSPRSHKLSLDKVLLTVRDKKVKIGNPYLKGAKVNCEIITRLKDEKKIAFKYRKRKSSQSKRGHRQRLILVKVKEIKIA